MRGDNGAVMIEANGVSKKFCKNFRRALWYGVKDVANELAVWRDSKSSLRPGEFWAVQDISFRLQRGEALGILGHNGAGKSTLLKMLHGLIKPDDGEIEVHGRVGAMIELGAGFSPLLSGRENIYLMSAVLGLTRKKTEQVIRPIIEFSGLQDSIDAPVQTYSSGMWARLAYSVAAHLQPDILLVDEVLAVGDLDFQRKCLQHMQQYVKSGGSLLLVSHNLYQLQFTCPRTLLLDEGRIVFAGDTVSAVNRYIELRGGPSRTALPGASAPEKGGQRPATVIERIEIKGADGELITGSPARVEIQLRSEEEVGAVNWGWTVWSADLEVCIMFAFTDDASRWLGKGAATFAGTLPELQLNAGCYALRAAVTDVNGAVVAWYGWDIPPLFFTVRSSVTRLNNINSMLGAIITPRVHWEAQ